MTVNLITRNLSIFLFFILTLFSLTALTGCSTLSSKGSLNDEDTIADAIPKDEPLSEGSDRAYRVRGKTYHPMKSSKHYKAYGTATWYGKEFNHKRTSSGERYNIMAMTAAHRTLPLPSYVQVTNLNNGKKVIVRVNDRGPFTGNHLIDLSYIAAKKIGILGAGSAPVNLTAIDPSEYHKQAITEKPIMVADTSQPHSKHHHAKMLGARKTHTKKILATHKIHNPKILSSHTPHKTKTLARL